MKLTSRCISTVICICILMSNSKGTYSQALNHEATNNVQIDSTPNLYRIAVSAYGTCALTDAGSVKCWGKGEILGSGPVGDRLFCGLCT